MPPWEGLEVLDERIEEMDDVGRARNLPSFVNIRYWTAHLRDALVGAFLQITDRIAGWDRTLEEVKASQRAPSAEMKREVAWMKQWDGEVATIAAGST